MSCGSQCVPEGPRGLSAYDIWLAEGNTGTEQIFLDSLVGKTGPDGPAGIQGPAGECECETVEYNEERSHVVPTVADVVTNSLFTATVAGTYEYMMVGHCNFTDNNEITLILRKNGSVYSASSTRKIAVGDGAFIIPFTLFISNISLNVGQTLDVTSVKSSVNTAILNEIILKVTKLAW